MPSALCGGAAGAGAGAGLGAGKGDCVTGAIREQKEVRDDEGAAGVVVPPLVTPLISVLLAAAGAGTLAVVDAANGLAWFSGFAGAGTGGVACPLCCGGSGFGRFRAA